MEFESQEEVIAKFDDGEFVPHALVDDLLSKYQTPAQLDEIHSASTRLLSQLDAHSQDLTKKLESLTSDITRSSKKVQYEMELLRADVATLVQGMDEDAGPKVEELKRIQLENESVGELEKLALAKAQMRLVQQTFTEAKAFDETRISTELKQVLEDGNTEAAHTLVDRLAQLIKIWKGTSVYASRQKFIESLRRDLNAHETKLGPPSRSLQRDRTPEYTASPASGPGSTSTPPPSDRATSPSRKAPDSYYRLIDSLQRKIGY